MKFTQIATVAVAATGAVAGPLAKRDSDIAREVISKRAGAALTDAQILNFALTLEHLEATFYQAAVTNYSAAQFAAAGLPAPYYENVVRLRNQEATHVNFLTGALKAAGAKPVAACKYAFPVNSPKSFAAVAQILEGVGVSAYSGAAAAIVSDDYLTAAATILGVEARHASYLRSKNGVSPYPAVFEIPLNINQVYALASPFIVSCPSSNPALPVTKKFPSLSLSPSQKMPIKVGDTITLVTSASYSAAKYACWPLVTGPVCMPATKKSATTYTTVVPKGGVTGQGYVLLSSADAKSFSDDTTLAGPAIVETLPPVVV